MKKHEKKITTDRFEAVLVTHELEQEDTEPPPANYLLIGAPGSQLARIEGVDSEVVTLLLGHVGVPPFYRLTPRGRGGICPV